MKSTCMRCGDGTLLEQFRTQLAEVTQELNMVREARRVDGEASLNNLNEIIRLGDQLATVTGERDRLREAWKKLHTKAEHYALMAWAFNAREIAASCMDAIRDTAQRAEAAEKALADCTRSHQRTNAKLAETEKDAELLDWLIDRLNSAEDTDDLWDLCPGKSDDVHEEFRAAIRAAREKK